MNLLDVIASERSERGDLVGIATSSRRDVGTPRNDGNLMKNPLLSVIILSFNTRNYLEQCLQSVAESKGFNAGELEVIVVDNGSTDGSIEIVHKFIRGHSDPDPGSRGRIPTGSFAPLRMTLVENKENLGFAGGNNVGIRKAKGKYILLLNSDTTVYSDTLIKMVRFADGLSKLGAATCRIELPSGKIDPACHRGFPTPWNALTYISGLEKLFPKLKIFGGYHQGWKNYSALHEADVISGAFFMVPRKVIDKIGLLDESFFMYGEDIDWCYRIKQAGFEIWYNPEAKILHYKKQSGRAKNREYPPAGEAERTENREQSVKSRADYHFVYTMEQFYRKHYMKKYPKVISWVVLSVLRIYLASSRATEGSAAISSGLPRRPAYGVTPRNDGERLTKVVIDARLAGLQNAGIGRYIQSLCERLENHKSYIINHNLEIKTVSPKVRHYTFVEQILMPGLLAKEKPDLVHFPHFNVPLLYNKPFVVTIHDLLWHERVGFSATTLPKWLYLIKYIGYRAVLRHAILKAKAVIVPSKWVKEKIVERFPQINSKIYVIYEGVSEAFKTRLPRPPLRGSLAMTPTPYLIYTGSLYPHKNVAVILNVLKYFDDLKLVVACARSVFWEKFRQEVRKKGLEDRVVLAGFVPDEELAVLYRKAAAFVFPSLSEGFGLPGLEAMAAGCPVISSNAGALPEIYGEAAMYFDPNSEEKLLEGIRRIRGMRGKERGEMIEKGKKRVALFSWEKCAKETMEVYESCFSLRQDK